MEFRKYFSEEDIENSLIFSTSTRTKYNSLSTFDQVSGIQKWLLSQFPGWREDP